MTASLFNLAGPDLIIILLLCAPAAFVIWMIVDCVNYETDAGNTKLIWVLIILLLPLGSFVYLFARKIGRKKILPGREPVADLLKPPPSSETKQPPQMPPMAGTGDEMLVRDYLKDRQCSRTKYALTRGMLGFGIPFVVGALVIQRLLFANENIWSNIGFASVMIPGGLWYGYRFLARKWDAAQKKVSDARDSTAASPSQIIADSPQTPSRAPDQPTPSQAAPKAAIARKIFGIIGLAITIAVVGVVGLIIAIAVFAGGHPNGTARTETYSPPAPAPANEADPINANIVRALRESEEAVEAKPERGADQERLEKWEARVAEQRKRKQAIDAAEAKRVAAEKEAEAKSAAALKESEYPAWKAKRKAEMREAAANLRPEQVAAWNQAVAAWNKLTPAQREVRLRQEYEQLATSPKWGADIIKPR